MLIDNILELVGNTPLQQLRGEKIFAKAEFLNPGGNIKYRVALAADGRHVGWLRTSRAISQPSCRTGRNAISAPLCYDFFR